MKDLEIFRKLTVDRPKYAFKEELDTVERSLKALEVIKKYLYARQHCFEFDTITEWDSEDFAILKDWFEHLDLEDK